MSEEKDSGRGLVVSRNRSMLKSPTNLVHRGLESLAKVEDALVVRSQEEPYELIDEELIDDIIIRGWDLYRDRLSFKEWAQSLRQELDLGPEADHLGDLWVMFTRSEDELIRKYKAELELKSTSEDVRIKAIVRLDRIGLANKDLLALALDDDPPFARAYYHRGRAKEHNGDHDGAIGDYTRAIEIDPRYARAYNSRGIAKGHAGDPDGAIDDYNKAIEIDPEAADFYDNRGEAKFEQGDLDGFRTDIAKASEINPRRYPPE